MNSTAAQALKTNRSQSAKDPNVKSTAAQAPKTNRSQSAKHPNVNSTAAQAPKTNSSQSAKDPNVNSTATQAPKTNGSGVVNSGNETVSTRIAASKLLVMVLSIFSSYLRLNFLKLFSICENGHKLKFNRKKCGVTVAVRRLKTSTANLDL